MLNMEDDARGNDSVPFVLGLPMTQPTVLPITTWSQGTVSSMPHQFYGLLTNDELSHLSYYQIMALTTEHKAHLSSSQMLVLFNTAMAALGRTFDEARFQKFLCYPYRVPSSAAPAPIITPFVAQEPGSCVQMVSNLAPDWMSMPFMHPLPPPSSQQLPPVQQSPALNSWSHGPSLTSFISTLSPTPQSFMHQSVSTRELPPSTMTYAPFRTLQYPWAPSAEPNTSLAAPLSAASAPPLVDKIAVNVSSISRFLPSNSSVPKSASIGLHSDAPQPAPKTPVSQSLRALSLPVAPQSQHRPAPNAPNASNAVDVVDERGKLQQMPVQNLTPLTQSMSKLATLMMKAPNAQVQKVIVVPVEQDAQPGELEGDDDYMYPKPTSVAKRTQKRSVQSLPPQTNVPVSSRTVMKIRVKSNKVDARKCALCHGVGDGTPLTVQYHVTSGSEDTPSTCLPRTAHFDWITSLSIILTRI